jgi:hypothetical protein
MMEADGGWWKNQGWQPLEGAGSRFGCQVLNSTVLSRFSRFRDVVTKCERKKSRITAIKSVPQNSNNEQRQYVSARVYIAGRLLLCALQARPSWLDVGFFQLLDQM